MDSTFLIERMHFTVSHDETVSSLSEDMSQKTCLRRHLSHHQPHTCQARVALGARPVESPGEPRNHGQVLEEMHAHRCRAEAHHPADNNPGSRSASQHKRATCSGRGQGVASQHQRARACKSQSLARKTAGQRRWTGDVALTRAGRYQCS